MDFMSLLVGFLASSSEVRLVKIAYIPTPDSASPIVASVPLVPFNNVRSNFMKISVSVSRDANDEMTQIIVELVSDVSSLSFRDLEVYVKAFLNVKAPFDPIKTRFIFYRSSYKVYEFAFNFKEKEYAQSDNQFFSSIEEAEEFAMFLWGLA